ncbi:WD domain, G-beta repeat protein [Oesophagostomum dentatum]|uniref:Coronin n=1 Tax=Oesophagostomum dentatum TaxID=61180 RepID=A0A0B1T508_OESDE|nr:WD domain, G-beta repeat protein [Oesophagostomum dentatum]
MAINNHSTQTLRDHAAYCCGENKLLLWNVGTGEALLEIAGHPDQIWCIGFNYDGSQFVTTCKDKKIRILDTRSGEVVHEGMGHEGVKPMRAIFVHDGRIITTGFTKRSERLYALRAPDNLSQPIIEEELDTSNGVLFPLYDEDTGLVYLCGKGDCAIRYYEVNQEYPYVHYINTYTTSEPQRAIGFQSKRGVCSEENEINRIYKLTTKGLVEVLQFFVPRKSDLFQHDLYPDTRSTVPALTAEEFMSGKNAVPNTQPVNPAAAQAKPKIQVVKKANILNQLAPTPTEVSPRSYSEQSSPHVSAPPSPRPSPQQQPTQQQRRPIIDEDMGIVPMNQSTSKGTSKSASQAQHRPPSSQQHYPERLSPDRPTQLTPKQQSRTATEEDFANPPPRSQPAATPSPRMSVSSTDGPTNLEELLADFAKMKAVMRQHERRIRILEEEIAESNMSNAYSF